MGSLEAFVHYENLILFKKQLADPRTSDEQRQLLLRLLAKEEANKPGPEHPPVPGTTAATRQAT